MKVLFLDIDGVLNPEINVHNQFKRGQNTSSYCIKLDKVCLLNLKKIIEKTKARIVITSNWRRGGFNTSPAIRNLTKQFKEYGLHIYSFTPILSETKNTLEREREIRTFLKWNPQIDKYAILDDKCMGIGLSKRSVRCSRHYGLTSKEADRVIKLLS